MYTEGHKVKDAKKLPLNLLDALRALEASERAAREGSGDAVHLRLPQAQDVPSGTTMPAISPSGSARTTLDC